MEHLGFGLQVTILGLGLVFGLLALLWGLLALLARLDRGEEPTAARSSPTGEPAGRMLTMSAAAAGLDPDLVAAISVAVLTHKAVRRRQAAPFMRSYWPGALLYASRWVGSGRMRQNAAWQRARR